MTDHMAACHVWISSPPKVLPDGQILPFIIPLLVTQSACSSFFVLILVVFHFSSETVDPCVKR